MKKIALGKLFCCMMFCFFMTACQINKSGITFRTENNRTSTWSWSILIALSMLCLVLLWVAWIFLAPVKTIRVQIVKKRTTHYETVGRDSTTFAYNKRIDTHCTIDVIPEGGTTVHTWRCNAEQIKKLREGKIYTIKVQSGTVLRIITPQEKHSH